VRDVHVGRQNGKQAGKTMKQYIKLFLRVCTQSLQ
jgi:hypothetical protein